MTTKFVSLLAVLVFSFSAFAQKAREHSVETKAKVESISKLQGKEANKRIIEDLLNTISEGGKSKPEKLESGLNELFKEDIVEKVKFGANLRTMLESPEQATRNAGKHMKGLLERLSDMKDSDVQIVVKRLLKNSDISMSEVASTYEAQLAATNLLTYKKYVKGESSIDANTIELVGIANVMKSELPGIKGEGKSDIITSLKDLNAEQRKAVELKRDEWKGKCNS